MCARESVGKRGDERASERVERARARTREPHGGIRTNVAGSLRLARRL